jgi:hypothetical protein
MGGGGGVGGITDVAGMGLGGGDVLGLNGAHALGAGSGDGGRARHHNYHSAYGAMAVEYVVAPGGVLPELSRDAGAVRMHPHVAALLCALWAVAWLALSRRWLARRLAPTPLRALPAHAEGFALAGLATTLCINAASYMHTPGPRLFDVGFAVIPELAPGSPWHATSDALTGALPALLALHGTVALDRRARAELTTAWLRLMTVRRVACDAACLVCAGLGGEGHPVWSGLGGETGGDVPAVCVRGSPPTGRDTPSHPVDHSRVGRLLVLASLPSRRSSMGCAASP